MPRIRASNISTADAPLFRVRLGIATVCVALLAGCNAHTGAGADVTGSISPAASASADPNRADVDAWSKRYAAAPNDKNTDLAYAGALKSVGRYAEAVAILETAAVRNPTDPAVLGAYGKALANVGRFQEAQHVLDNAQSPEHPDWSILSSQGTVADQLGNHLQAQQFYLTALKIAPGQADVLSNLGLSYALSKQLDLAESTLRQAAAVPGADARVRQNLALILALRGKFAEAEAVDRTDLPPAQAAANVQAIRQMIAQSDTWSKIQNADRQSSSVPIAARPGT